LHGRATGSDLIPRFANNNVVRRNSKILESVAKSVETSSRSVVVGGDPIASGYAQAPSAGVP